MSWLRRWFGKSPPAGREPIPREPARAEIELLREESPAQTAPPIVVPQGHRVVTFPVPTGPGPSLFHTDGGVWIASLGHGSDEPIEELDGLLQELQPQLSTAQRPVLLSGIDGPLSELFAPANPWVRSVPRALLWIFNRPGLDNWLEKPARLQTLLRRLYRLGVLTQLTQCVSFEPDSGPGATVMARLFAGLGLGVRALGPDPHRLVMAEVHRPEGVVISAPLGNPRPLGDAAVDPYPSTVNQEKAAAEAQEDRQRLMDLETQERNHLARLVQPVLPHLDQGALLRAPRLCRLLRTVVDQGSPAARRALDEELLRRDQLLQLLMKPDGRSTFTATFPGVGSVLRGYPDLISLKLTARDLHLAEGSYLPGGMPARQLFDWGAKMNVSVALNVFMATHTPSYVVWTPEEVRLMAAGRLPPRGD
jgi:hypothetical protein